MTTINIYYSPFNMVMFFLLTGFGAIGSPIMLIPLWTDSIKRGNGAAIMFLILLLCLNLILIPIFLVILKCFIACIKKQPAIEMTPEYYIDNIEQVKISWNKISDVYILELKNSFLKVAVSDEEVVYSQAKNFLYKYMFSRNSSNGGILSVNLSFLKGKNKNIVNTIIDYRQKILNL